VLCGHIRSSALTFALAHQTCIRVQLGIDAFNGARHDEAAEHFTAAVNSTAFSSKLKTNFHLLYEDLVVVRRYAHSKMLS
jgi:hypothetical protein